MGFVSQQVDGVRLGPAYKILPQFSGNDQLIYLPMSYFTYVAMAKQQNFICV